MRDTEISADQHGMSMHVCPSLPIPHFPLCHLDVHRTPRRLNSPRFFCLVCFVDCPCLPPLCGDESRRNTDKNMQRERSSEGVGCVCACVFVCACVDVYCCSVPLPLHVRAKTKPEMDWEGRGQAVTLGCLQHLEGM